MSVVANQVGAVVALSSDVALPKNEIVGAVRPAVSVNEAVFDSAVVLTSVAVTPILGPGFSVDELVPLATEVEPVAVALVDTDSADAVKPVPGQLDEVPQASVPKTRRKRMPRKENVTLDSTLTVAVDGELRAAFAEICQRGQVSQDEILTALVTEFVKFSRQTHAG